MVRADTCSDWVGVYAACLPSHSPSSLPQHQEVQCECKTADGVFVELVVSRSRMLVIIYRVILRCCSWATLGSVAVVSTLS